LVASSSPASASGGARMGRLDVNGVSSSVSPGAEPYPLVAAK
jgi:hypothetical protein